MCVLSNKCFNVMNEKEKLSELNYKTYLQLDQLLSLQQLHSDGEHDEMLFITIHQIYEMWFKQILHELSTLNSSFSTHEEYKIMLTLKRVRHILKVLVLQMDVIETMHPFSFYSFRKYLGTASGFQSLQFREIEFLLGIKKKAILDSFLPGSSEHKILLKRYNENSIWEDFIHWIKISVKGVSIDSSSNPKGFNEIQLLLLHIYKNHSIYTEIVELLLDIDEGLQEWRYRHVKLIERIIGNGTSGTGGSSGFNYLRSTVHISFCPDLWKIRNYFY